MIDPRKILAGVVVACAIAVPATAQEDEFDPRKVIKEIQTDMKSIIDEMSELSGAPDAETGKRVTENIDKLLEGMSSSQGRVVEKIDELIKNTKLQQSSSSSSSSGQQQQQQGGQQRPQQPGGRRDRNQPQGGQKERDGGQQNQPEGQKPQNQDGNPEGGEESRGEPQNSKTGRKPQERDPELYEKILREGKWGALPPETRQRLVESAFREYFPDYEREIREYLKSLNRGRRR